MIDQTAAAIGVPTPPWRLNLPGPQDVLWQKKTSCWSRLHLKGFHPSSKHSPLQLAHACPIRLMLSSAADRRQPGARRQEGLPGGLPMTSVSEGPPGLSPCPQATWWPLCDPSAEGEVVEFLSARHGPGGSPGAQTAGGVAW